MSEARKNAVGPWIAALLVGLPVVYVASFGPACWWFSGEETNRRALDSTPDRQVTAIASRRATFATETHAPDPTSIKLVARRR
jgi:hypothetical protein